MAQRDIVLFLGAGFSVDAGLPTMPRFGIEGALDHFHLRQHARAEPTSRDHRLAAAELVEAAERFEAFRDQCVQSGVLTRTDWDNVETLFSVLDSLERAGAPELWVKDEIAPISIYREALQLWIWKVYHQLPLVGRATESTNPHPYRRLFKFIESRELADRITVITTNYDIVFEYLAFTHGIPCAYPVQWVPENGGVTENDQHWVHPQTASTAGPVVCKLHGSINYFGVDDLFIVASDLGGSDPIGKSAGFEGKAAILAVDSLHALRTSFGEGLTPLIVPPSYDKNRDDPWHRRTLNQAFEALLSARVIGFVGYSLPPTDGFIASLLAGTTAFRGASRQPPHVFVVDPSVEVHERYRRLFGSLLSDLAPMTFGQASKGDLQRAIHDGLV